MAEQQDTDRWKYIRGLHFEYANFYRILTGVLIFGLVLSIGLNTFREEDEPRSFAMNLWSEFAGIAVTVLIVDQLNRQREDKQRKERLVENERQALLQYQRQLIDEAASTSNETARHAISIIQRRNWLRDQASILQGADLTDANLKSVSLRNANLNKSVLRRTILHEAVLEGATLVEADLVAVRMEHAHLSSANLWGANLKYAHLRDTWISDCFLMYANLSQADMREVHGDDTIMHHADLTKANLEHAHLEGTDLRFADLTEANLNGANLKNVSFEGANLQEANLCGANLIGADLENAQFSDLTVFDQNTKLPNGSRWQPETDLTIFTNRNHPTMFWREEVDENSYAYEGEYT